ncbi:TspO/MBR family protein [Haloarchaeobius litoreus]|uniref:TspO/MBR family protein n=1 Tax=Haloarchaeobius litoreus TaxID=755306 RepID=A0ABD6DLV2_9EURY|nr:TspO/MBR family protein [Haloarchaeobius litoreus]
MPSTNDGSTAASRLPDGGDLLRLVGFVVLVNVVGATPAVLGGPDSAWFQALEKPWFYPPGWAFGVAWTILFTLMGVALYRVWREGTERRAVRLAIGAFALQMVFNVAWTPTFFTLQRPGLALGVIAVLWVLVAGTIAAFDRVDRPAAALLVPYLAWVSFATVLNYALWSLN